MSEKKDPDSPKPGEKSPGDDASDPVPASNLEADRPAPDPQAEQPDEKVEVTKEVEEDVPKSEDTGDTGQEVDQPSVEPETEIKENKEASVENDVVEKPNGASEEPGSTNPSDENDVVEKPDEEPVSTNPTDDKKASDDVNKKPDDTSEESSTPKTTHNKKAGDDKSSDTPEPMSEKVLEPTADVKASEPEQAQTVKDEKVESNDAKDEKPSKTESTPVEQVVEEESSEALDKKEDLKLNLEEKEDSDDKKVVAVPEASEEDPASLSPRLSQEIMTNTDLSDQDKFRKIKELVVSGKMRNKEVVDSVLHLVRSFH